MQKANFKGADNVFSKRLKDLMGNNGVTQDMLAQVLDVKRQTISLYINGASAPPLEKFVDIANYFNVSTDYLLGKTEIKTTDISIQKICEYTHLSENSVKTLFKYQKFIEIETEKLNTLLSKANGNKRKKSNITFEEESDIQKHQINISMSEQFQEFLDLFIVYPEAPILANNFFEAIENGVKFYQYDGEKPWQIGDKNFLDYMEKSELEEYRYQKACMKLLKKVREDLLKEKTNNK